MDLQQSFEMDKIFTGWSAKELKTAFQIIYFLRIKGIEIESFEEYILFVMERSRVSDEISKKSFLLRLKIRNEQALICSECGYGMILLPVNVSKSNQLPDKRIKSTWMCTDQDGCGHQVYNQKPVKWYEDKITRKLKADYGKLSVDDIVNFDINIAEISKHSKNKGCGGRKNG